MKANRTLLLAVAIVCCTGLVGASSSGASNPAKGADIEGVGAGRIFFGLGNFNLSAHSGPNGDFGHVQESEPGLDVYVDIDCVAVHDGLAKKSAIISGIVRRVNANLFGIDVGDRETFQVDDGGEPRNDAFDAVDAFYFLYPAQNAQVDCKTIPPLVLSPDVTEGNIVVRSG